MSETREQELSRRRFIAATGKGIVTASVLGGLAQNASAQGASTQVMPVHLPPLAAPTEKQTGDPPAPMPPDKRVGFAIVGLGHLSLEQIMPAFADCKRARPVALVSGDADKAATVARQYGISPQSIYNYKNYDNLKNNPDVDVIYIVLPNSMHLEYTVRGAQAGKHILCEKPMATSVKDSQTMIDACKKAGKQLMIAYRCQYEPYNRLMTQMSRSKQFGDVKQIVAHNGQNQGDPNQWRQKKALAGGGCLPDVGIYCLNAARYLTGEEPIEVFATMVSTPGDPRFREVEESMQFTLRFPSGVLANCTTGYSFHEARSYRILAAAGWYGLEPAFPYQGIQAKTSHAEGKREIMEQPKLDDKNQFALEMDHMAQCVQENRTPYTPGEEGLQDMRIIAALYESAKAGHTIKLPHYDGLDVFRGSAPDAMA